jgi:hypothetical protein
MREKLFGHVFVPLCDVMKMEISNSELWAWESRFPIFQPQVDGFSISTTRRVHFCSLSHCTYTWSLLKLHYIQLFGIIDSSHFGFNHITIHNYWFLISMLYMLIVIVRLQLHLAHIITDISIGSLLYYLYFYYWLANSVACNDHFYYIANIAMKIKIIYRFNRLRFEHVHLFYWL